MRTTAGRLLKEHLSRLNKYDSDGIFAMIISESHKIGRGMLRQYQRGGVLEIPDDKVPEVQSRVKEAITQTILEFSLADRDRG